MCIGNEIIKNQMSAEKNHNAAREIKQRADNPDASETGDAIADDDNRQSNKKVNAYV